MISEINGMQIIGDKRNIYSEIRILVIEKPKLCFSHNLSERPTIPNSGMSGTTQFYLHYKP